MKNETNSLSLSCIFLDDLLTRSRSPRNQDLDKIRRFRGEAQFYWWDAYREGDYIVAMSFPGGARNVYERACDFFGDENMDERLYVAFAKFEERQKEVHLVNLIVTV